MWVCDMHERTLIHPGPFESVGPCSGGAVQAKCWGDVRAHIAGPTCTKSKCVLAMHSSRISQAMLGHTTAWDQFRQ